MQLGLYLRNMGPASMRDTVVECARQAEAAGIDEVWVADHIAIPPDDAEGSNGRYLDPLATLAFLAGVTTRIGLGTGVLVLPYRPPLATAKWVATVQELSGNRLLLGVGAGWMEPEFRAVGVDRRQRGRITDDTLSFLAECFASDEVEANGQRFLFRPRPPRPPIFIGGEPPHAFRRAIRFEAGWMPIGTPPEKLQLAIERLRSEAAEAGKKTPEVAVATSLDLADRARGAAQAAELARAGATRLIHGWRYTEASAFAEAAASLARIGEELRGA